MRALQALEGARNFIGHGLHTGRQWMGQIDAHMQRGFQMLGSLQPIVAEAANLFGNTRQKQLLNQAAQGISAARNKYGEIRGHAEKAGNLVDRFQHV